MQCTVCHYPHSAVLYTRKDEQQNQTYRRHECQRCGLRFTTYERVNYERIEKRGRPVKDVE